MNRIIKEANKISPGTWLVVLESWQGCKCTAKIKTVIVHKETRPLLRDVLAAMN